MIARLLGWPVATPPSLRSPVQRLPSVRWPLFHAVVLFQILHLSLRTGPVCSHLRGSSPGLQVSTVLLGRGGRLPSGHGVVLDGEGPGQPGSPGHRLPRREASSLSCSLPCAQKCSGTQNGGCAVTGRTGTRATSPRVPIMHHTSQGASVAFLACSVFTETSPPGWALT